MSSNPLLKVKVPYADNAEDLVEKFNYMVKTINSSFVDSSQASESGQLTGILNLDGIQLSQSWSGPAAFVASYTLNHNLGSIPSGWLLIDSTASGLSSGGSYSIYRSSWTTTQITITISVDTNTIASSAGSFKILVLR